MIKLVKKYLIRVLPVSLLLKILNFKLGIIVTQKSRKNQKFIDLNTNIDKNVKVNKDLSVVIHVHIYYKDLIREIFKYLKNIHLNFDLLISTADKSTYEVLYKEIHENTRIKKFQIRIVPNRGRDVAPFFVTFKEEIKKYDVVCHIHTKKSFPNIHTLKKHSYFFWRSFLLDSLLGSPEKIFRILTILSNKKTGVIYPEPYVCLNYSKSIKPSVWLKNWKNSTFWLSLVNIKKVPNYLLFPAGNMFWARVESLRPLLNLKLEYEDFQTEKDKLTDGSLAHFLERAVGWQPSLEGFCNYIIKSPINQYWRTNSLMEAKFKLSIENFNDNYYKRHFKENNFYFKKDFIKHYLISGFKTDRRTNDHINPKIINDQILIRGFTSYSKEKFDYKFYLENYYEAAECYLLGDIPPYIHYKELGQKLGYLPYKIE